MEINRCDKQINEVDFELVKMYKTKSQRIKLLRMS